MIERLRIPEPANDNFVTEGTKAVRENERWGTEELMAREKELADYRGEVERTRVWVDAHAPKPVLVSDIADVSRRENNKEIPNTFLTLRLVLADTEKSLADAEKAIQTRLGQRAPTEANLKLGTAEKAGVSESELRLAILQAQQHMVALVGVMHDAEELIKVKK